MDFFWAKPLKGKFLSNYLVHKQHKKTKFVPTIPTIPFSDRLLTPAGCIGLAMLQLMIKLGELFIFFLEDYTTCDLGIFR